jgi:hypothetical protein
VIHSDPSDSFRSIPILPIPNDTAVFGLTGKARARLVLVKMFARRADFCAADAPVLMTSELSFSLMFIQMPCVD